MRYRAFVAALLIPLCGCSLLSYDNRDKVAMAVLFPHDDPRRVYFSEQQFDGKVFSNALLARFPVGSRKEDLKAFVESLDGRCEDPYSEGMRCVIPESGQICYQTTIELLVVLHNDSIGDIQSYRRGVGC
jgi:hypothetical protein